MTLSTNSMVISGSFDATGGTFSSSGATQFTSTASETITSNSGSFGQVEFNGSGGSWILQDNMDANGHFTITQGTVDCNVSGNYAINVLGDWANSGTFISRNSTVTLDGTDQTVSGTN